jgi:hypothetical protein
VGKFVIQPTDDGSWRLMYRCVPEIQPLFEYPRGSISALPKADLANNENVIIDDSTERIIFEFRVDGTYIPTPDAAATGDITVGDVPSDNEWFFLDDGFGNAYYFEFKKTGAYVPTPGYVTVDVSAASLITDVVVLMNQAINDLDPLGISSVEASPNVDLTNDKVSSNGNQGIQLHPQLVVDGWTFTGMSGGTDEVITVDISAVTEALEVAQILSSSIAGSGLQIEADFPTVGVGFFLKSRIPGPAGNIPITTTVTTPGFVVSGMSGGSGGARWHFTLEPEQDALFRIRLYPNDWQDYDLLSGVPQTIVVDLQPNDEPAERIDLLLKGTGPDEVLMSDWNINGPRIGAVQHELVMRVLGEHNYGSTSMWVKQLWHSLDDLRMRYDVGDKYDHGSLKL